MARSVRKVVCKSCKKDCTVVSETPIPNPAIAGSVHLRVVCDTVGCSERGKDVEVDAVCFGVPACGIHDAGDFHDPNVPCAGGH